MNHNHRKTRKLQLQKQTLASLTERQLGAVVGGQVTDPTASGPTGYCLPSWGCTSAASACGCTG